MAVTRLSTEPTYEALKLELLAIFVEIAALDSLVPSPKTNEAFGSLVALVTAPFLDHSALASSAASDSDLLAQRNRIIDLCSTAEGELERYWAQDILSEIEKVRVERPENSWLPSLFAPRRPERDEEVLSILDRFPYLDNYSKLVSLEYHLLRACEASFTQILFVGGGPIPLSSLLLARDHLRSHIQEDSTTFIVDQDLVAVKLGAKLAFAVFASPLDSALCLTLPPLSATSSRTRISFLHSTASDLPSSILSATTVLILAALVGLTPEAKNELLIQLLRHLPAGAHVLLRSAEGLRGLVYPQVDEEGLLKACEEVGVGVRVITVAHPGNEIINSVVILQRV